MPVWLCQSEFSQEDNSSLEAQKQEFIQQGVPEKNIRNEVGSATDSIKEPSFVHCKNKFQVYFVETMTLKNRKK